MEDYLCRAQRKDGNGQVEGYVYEHEPPLVAFKTDSYQDPGSKWYILKTAFADWNMPRQVEFIEVDPATVGRFTGFLDSGGNKIWSNSICKFGNEFSKTYGTVYYKHGSYWLQLDAEDVIIPLKYAVMLPGFQVHS